MFTPLALLLPVKSNNYATGKKLTEPKLSAIRNNRMTVNIDVIVFCYTYRARYAG